MAPLDRLVLVVHDGDTAVERLDVVRRLYAEVFAEPPYHDGPAEVETFAAGWPGRAGRPAFRLVIGYRDDEPIGFTFGHGLGGQTCWWDGAVTAMPAGVTDEYPGRTFAVIEMAVRQPYRRRGVAGRLHTHLVAGLSVERTTLLVLPEAGGPRRAYETWGYRRVGRIRPFAHGPVFDAMTMSLAERRA